MCLAQSNNPIPSQYEPKPVWRTWAKDQRSFVCSSLEHKYQAEQRLINHLQVVIEQPPTVETIGLYYPLQLEPNLLGLLEKLPHKNWVFPRVGNASLGEVVTDLFFHQLPLTSLSFKQLAAANEDALKEVGFVPNNWGIWEPQATEPYITPSDIDMLIIPALAMDAQGIRLGYGGGYYDRWLTSCQGLKPIQTIGVCWEACRVQTLPKIALDVPLNGSCTELGFFVV